ncbi:MAG: class I SAM-dependent RNA methyltransferase [Alphaproteobacteria bacterium]|jgi:23S rRNA (uracil1939-C5)-methyltransferase|nr:class I SAM-dependent RNA methyltransferase [Alphaproteobacteria bacterium]MBN9567517.1 class I SAM-dependent RNA methyltransferase [Alphaproteobacteria bacterium]
MPIRITGLGHAGDGITEDGRFAPFTVPGDLVTLDAQDRLVEVVAASPDRVEPPCPHFGHCGGCALQHLKVPVYTAFKRDLVHRTLAQRGFSGIEVAEVHSVPPYTRRRVVLHAHKQGGQTRLGFHARGSHTIVDLSACVIMKPALFSCAAGLKPYLNQWLRENERIALHLTLADNGIALHLSWKHARAPAMIANLAKIAAYLDIIRMTEGDEILLEREAPQLRFGKADVRLPADPFLQPAREGEAILLSHIRNGVRGAKTIADLFCGLGTFSLPLAERHKVLAFDSDPAMVAALLTAARGTQGLKPVTAERRDLFRRPLLGPEIAQCDAIVLDPPRAGAAAQVAQIAESRLARLVYVSCNPASFARDARTLADRGFRIGTVFPVDQFLWSAELELAAVFTR